MGSTKKRDELLATLFHDEIVPIGKACRLSGTRLLDMGPDPVRDSYYVRRTRTRMEPADFELDLATPEGVRAALGTLDLADGSPAITRLVERIIQLAPAFDELEDSSSVSPYVYAMF
jgi:hypothetical protein